ncbi:methyl-accepting chemotaxis protein [Erwinia rhapontici]|uniref:methyl-accepting chemotaxis protein n=1 Tax=Erwinia rhapontici TaxID=55212 RepID=UPI0010F34B37|nr:methyl-accepting chemotaxis protein [Erwinia rhapontici]TDS99854.1 methyl-accepting chemotaxis protein-2 (aspartate sensor receptor) [Erwinia rhapontici]
MIILKFNDFSIGKKLFSGFILLICIIIGISGYGIYALKTIEHNSIKTTLTNDIGNQLDAARQNRLIYMHTGDDEKMKANGDAIQSMQTLIKDASQFTWRGEAQKQFEQLSANIERYSELRTDYYDKSRHSNQLAKNLLQQSDNRFLPNLQDDLKNTASDSDSLDKIFDLLFAFSLLSEAGNTLIAKHTPETISDFDALYRRTESLYNDSLAQWPEATKNVLTPVWMRYEALKASAETYLSAIAKTQLSADNMAQGANELNTTAATLIEMQTEYNTQVISRTITIITLLSLLAVFTGLVTAWAITRKITRPVSENLALAQRISSGDLTAQITASSKDELGELTQTMGAMNTRLCDMISGIRESVSHLASASSQIAAGNTDLASRTEQQSAAVVETASSMEELTSTVRLNADNALQASKLAASASADARKGGQIVSEVVSTMNGIAGSSKKITEIISVINGIAFQTNILALNAAVEAARAGEQGRGFAVVAGEVRTLAQRSADAAKEIESLINESVARIGTGTELVNKAGDSMGDIVNSVSHVSQIIDEISSASHEQRQGIEQIGKAVTEMDSTTQQNATLVQESSAAAISLEQQAKKLSEMVAIFKINTSRVHEGEFVVGSSSHNPLPLRAQTPKALEEEWTSF